MRQGTYLNVILTVNAILLTGMLWAQVAGRPVLAGEASAQSTGAASAIPVNAAEQRKQMIDLLRDIRSSVDATRKTIEGGRFKVEVTNLEKMRTAADTR